MKLPHRSTLLWIGAAAGSFALGWIAKPSPSPEDAGAAPDRAAALPSAPSLHGGGSHGSGGSGAAALAGSDAAISGDAPQGARSGAPLTDGEIEAIGGRFKTELDPIKRRFAFAELLDGLTLENAAKIREQIAHLPSNSPEFIEFHYAWGKIGGSPAVIAGAETDKQDMAATLAGWASADPSAAIAWYSSLDKDREASGNGLNQGNLVEGMVHGLANRDPSEATRFVMGLAESGDKNAVRLLDIVTGKVMQSQGAERAADWAAALPDGDLRASAMGRVANDFARQDPEAAAAWAAPLAGQAGGDRVLGAVSREWARRDGAAAVGWLATVDASESSPGAYYGAFEGWASQDPHAASEYLIAMPESKGKDHAIGGLVSRARWEDPEGAIAWAGQISDPKTRESWTIGAAQAYYRRDPNAAREWLASSGLSEDAQKKVTGGRR